jgi:hypothetical protein
MDIEQIRKLVEQAELRGSAKYRVYVLNKLEHAYELLMNGKIMARFVVTGYEQGYLEENASKTAYQVKTVEALQAFLTGQH